jgi:hypothetical protein
MQFNYLIIILKNMKTTKTTTNIFITAIIIIIYSVITLTSIKAYAQVGIGVGDTASAVLHLKAGTTDPGTAPLKFTAGPLLTQVEPGAIEYKGHTFYATTYLVRRSVLLGQDVIITPVTATNTSEVLVYTQTMAANYLTAGKVIIAKLNGRFSTNGTGSSNLFTVHVKFNGSDIFTITSTSQDAVNRAVEIDLTSTVRSIGVSGQIITFGKTTQDNVAGNSGMGTVQTINTANVNTITVTVSWASTNVNNTITVEQGYTECVDANN